MRGCAGSGRDLAREQHRDRGDGEDCTNEGERVAKTDDEGLALHDVADGNDCLMICNRWIGNAVREEIVRHFGDALPHLVAIERH